MYSSLLVKLALHKAAGPVSRMIKSLLVKEMPGSYKRLPGRYKVPYMGGPPVLEGGSLYHIGLERPTSYDFLNMAGVGSHPRATVGNFMRTIKSMTTAPDPSLSMLGRRWKTRLNYYQRAYPYDGPTMLKSPFTPAESARKTIYPNFLSKFNPEERDAIRRSIVSNRALNLMDVNPSLIRRPAEALAHAADNITGAFPVEKTEILPPSRTSIMRRPGVKAF